MEAFDFPGEDPFKRRPGCLLSRMFLAFAFMAMAAVLGVYWIVFIDESDDGEGDASTATDTSDEIVGTVPPSITQVEPLTVDETGGLSCTTESFSATVSSGDVRAAPEGTGEILLGLTGTAEDFDFALAGDEELLAGLELLDQFAGPDLHQLILERDEPFPEGPRDLVLTVSAAENQCSISLTFEAYESSSTSDDPFGDLTGLRCTTAGHQTLFNGNYFEMTPDEIFDRELYVEPDRDETPVSLSGDPEFVGAAVAAHTGDLLTIRARDGALLPVGQWSITVSLALPDGECAYDLTMVVEP
ncbi:MAG: hypothetical protein R8F63_18145 [Acidimicrobiales bacterium]|nr:hypothetical protein [Acidimicrobiales bacterium]